MNAFIDNPHDPGLRDSARPPETSECFSLTVNPLLARLLTAQVVLHAEWEEVSSAERDEIAGLSSMETLLERLSRRHLLTRFQETAIRKGLVEDLILGHYRLLEMIGRGGMGTVYRAEHIYLRRQVALKVLNRATMGGARLLHRFSSEARVIALLQHPNLVTCFDAGRSDRPATLGGPQDYFVMEFIPGQDLHALVFEKGPLSPRRVCELFRQAAEALGEAHRHGLVHRDIKPGNILVTAAWQAKVLDFGLARVPSAHMTEPGTLLGTIGYMAPEQANNPSAVDARADLYGLGASMYWALTGREPYPESGNPIQDLHRRMTTSPPPVRQVRPEVPAELSELVERLMSTDPENRFPSARTLAAALSGFALWLAPGTPTCEKGGKDRVLLVDDDPSVRGMMAAALGDRYEVSEAADAADAITEARRIHPDLLVVDLNLPGVSGSELLNRLRCAAADSSRPKAMLISGEVAAEALGALSASTADDFLSKPFAASEFLSRVQAVLLRGSVKANSEQVTTAGTVRIPVGATTRAPLQPAMAADPLVTARAVSFLASRILVDQALLSDGHFTRLPHYVRAMAQAVEGSGEYARLNDEAYTELLACVAPGHDLGLLGVPKGVLMKTDRLDADERSVVQTHTTQGGDLFLALAGKFVAEVPTLPMAAEVARSHHERWDGSGYPDKLAGGEIPLSARVVALASVYEALRSRRPYRPALGHSRAVQVILEESPGQFDPKLVSAFSKVATQFNQIHHKG